jgi:two-component system, OmpR family, sensor histidine kinase MprB
VKVKRTPNGARGRRFTFTALPLRSRLALLTALAVAVAVAVCALVAWFLVRDQLTSSLDQQLHDTDAAPLAVQALREGRCQPEAPQQPDGDDEDVRTPFNYTIQVVDGEDGSCLVTGNATLDVTEADRAVALAGTMEVTVTHDATGSDGQTYRVMTRPLPGGTELAVSVARPLDEVTDPLRSLAVVLALVAAAGAVGAAGVGVALARAGLRPVDRLTQAAEHIARTQDLSVRLPVNEVNGLDGASGARAGAGAGDDEIARLSRSFNSMTAALASSRELQQQLIADAGHELRTPLTSLRTNIELLTRSEETGRPLPEADRRRLLASVTDQMTELASLIGDLQELSRPATSGARLEVVGLHEVTRRALRRVGLRAAGLAIDAELDPWYVRADPAALERAVVNLLDNAVKFGATGEGGVEVGLREGVLSIRDHGPGIPPDELPHVFERFWRSPGARGLPGSGLGLSIVARTVRDCGGDISLRPAAGGGTEALLTIPGAPGPPPDQEAYGTRQGGTEGP